MAEPGKKGEPAKIRPRIGRWEVSEGGDVSLIGTRCRQCGEEFFPEHAVCGKCGSSDTEEIRLVGPAQLFSYTIVHQLPAGFPKEMTVGYGKLAGDVLVLAPIDGPTDQLTVGMPLELHIGVTRIDDDGEPMESYRFRPAAIHGGGGNA